MTSAYHKDGFLIQAVNILFILFNVISIFSWTRLALLLCIFFYTVNKIFLIHTHCAHSSSSSRCLSLCAMYMPVLACVPRPNTEGHCCVKITPSCSESFKHAKFRGLFMRNYKYWIQNSWCDLKLWVWIITLNRYQMCCPAADLSSTSTWHEKQVDRRQLMIVVVNDT